MPTSLWHPRQVCNKPETSPLAQIPRGSWHSGIWALHHPYWARFRCSDVLKYGKLPGHVCSLRPGHLSSCERQCACAYVVLFYPRLDVPFWSRLRSSNSDQLIVPSFNLTTVGRQAFPVSAASLWNNLPEHFTVALSLTIFLQHLMTTFLAFLPDWIFWHSELTSCTVDLPQASSVCVI